MKKKEKKSYHALCPKCGLTLEIYEKFPFIFYVENNTCPHCHSKLIIESNRICNLMNIIMAIIFILVMENKIICFAAITIVILYLMFSRKTKQRLIYFKYFKIKKIG